MSADTEAIIRETKLTYASDARPGISRLRRGKDFIYRDQSGNTIKQPEVLERIRKLGIPPAWENVWICPSPWGHIQATGRDEKGRKQYRYHSEWVARSQENKFGSMVSFCRVLPGIRQEVEDGMKERELNERKVLATIIWLLDNTYLRIGNREYAQENSHFGLTTLRNEHVQVSENKTVFEYVGKSGKHQKVSVENPKISRIIRRLEELPGYELFQYVRADGSRHAVTSGDVNAYLKSITGEDVSAKYFRTWAGTVLAAVTLRDMGKAETKKEARKNITRTVKEVSRHLRNTPAVCRRYYIHPLVLRAYEGGSLIPRLRDRTNNRNKPVRLSSDEYAVMRMLEDA